MQSHLLTATAAHLDLACVKLNDTEDQLNNTQTQLNNTQVQLNKTQIQLNDAQTRLNKTQVQLNETQETTRELVQKVDALQKRLNEKQQYKAVEKTVIQMKQKKTFMWKIDSFSEILREAKLGVNTRIESVPFYTESCGYKLKVWLYPNGVGCGKDTHLSVYNQVMKGEYDAILPWPFQKAVKLTLIDQQPSAFFRRENVEHAFTQSIPCRPTIEGNINNSLGFPHFVSHEKLKTRHYLVDDTLFLQVEVGPVSSEFQSWSTSSLRTYPLV